MSWAAVKWAREAQPGPSVVKERTLKRGVVLVPVSASDRKHILRELADHVHGDARPWRCFVSVQALARDCSMSDRTLKRVLRSLITDGWIIRRRPAYGEVMVTVLCPDAGHLSTSPN